MTTLRYAGNGKPNMDGPRLDGFILEKLPALSTGLLHKYLRQNKIKLNGKKQPLSTRLQPGDEVRLYLPDTASEAPPVKVLYEDGRLLALDKPAGLASEGDGGTDSLLARAQAYVAGRQGNAVQPALCHRLDTGTSGVVLLAKDAATLQLVTGLLHQRHIQKTYLAVTVGTPAPASGSLKGWLLKDTQTGIVRALDRPAPGAKTAETDYETLASGERLALLKLRPHTGRTHQLRVQLAQLSTPILGDSKYGTQKLNRELRCKYQCLCAASVQFPTGLEAPFQGLDGLHIQCEAPWYVRQVQDGTLV